MVRYPFEVTTEHLKSDPDPFIDAVFASLGSEFMTMPKGTGFVEYSVFEQGFEELKKATGGFTSNTTSNILAASSKYAIALVVVRTILGFTPPEWAYAATQHTGVVVSQGFVRNLDRQIRLQSGQPRQANEASEPRIIALAETAAYLLNGDYARDNPETLHRLNKVDTRGGSNTIKNSADMGIPYAMLLYERFLGRPFAGHRDSISDLIGDVLETAIEKRLMEAGISFRKTKRAEKIEGFDQTPDFIIPSEFNPQIVIEAKICEDDGTARDKVTRIQHLHELSMQRGTDSAPSFGVIACISGRGFGVRRADMLKLLEATQGKVFTFQTLDNLVRFSRLMEFQTKEL